MGLGRVSAVVVAACALACTVASPARPSGPLETAIVDPSTFTDPAADLAYARTWNAGARAVRLVLFWRTVVNFRYRPAGVDLTDPASPAYRWQGFDRQVQLAVARGLEPIVTVQDAPDWASGYDLLEPGTVRPNPDDFANFSLAAARRYSGTFGGLPRVRYWQAWNEPNISLFLKPQVVDGIPFSPDWYRRMLNAFAAAVKSVHPDNQVIAGGLAPFRDARVPGDWGPLTFMRALLCMGPDLRPTCSDRTHFDIWDHHPYTSGGPTRHAVLPDDVSLGDLPKMTRLLNAAIQAGNVVSDGKVQFWVLEFSWDSSPPDPAGVPSALETRWVAEALYRMWKAGVSTVAWFQLRDEPMDTSFYQSGLYYRGATLVADRPKPSLAAFRFPFVALPEKHRVYVWGRTPGGRPASVLVELSVRHGWKRLGVVRSDRYGIIQRQFRVQRPAGFVRARTVDRGERAVPFSLAHVPDRFFNPFGLPNLIEQGG